MADPQTINPKDRSFANNLKYAKYAQAALEKAGVNQETAEAAATIGKQTAQFQKFGSVAGPVGTAVGTGVGAVTGAVQTKKGRRWLLYTGLAIAALASLNFLIITVVIIVVLQSLGLV